MLLPKEQDKTETMAAVSDDVSMTEAPGVGDESLAPMQRITIQEQRIRIVSSDGLRTRHDG